jgi:endo-1,4-beta-xylanase
VFFRLLGENFADIAFKAAREADPSTKLYINDYTLEDGGVKLDSMISFVKRLKARNVPIDGIGSQTHVEMVSNGGDIDIN